jgi:hypothetical protein
MTKELEKSSGRFLEGEPTNFPERRLALLATQERQTKSLR